MLFRQRARKAGAAAALLAVLILAAGLRLYRLDSAPDGLHFDEAAYGLLTLRVLDGELPVFFSEYAGREAAYMYLAAPSLALLGRTILAIRLPAALLGVLAVGLTYLLGRRMLGRGGALLAAGAAAGVPWLLHINRLGFRANLLPVTLALWAWLLLRGLDQNRRRDWAGAGLVLGLTAYTYLAARFVPILVLAFLIYLALLHRPLLRERWRGLTLMLGLGLVVALPLGLHFWRVPADWGERIEQVSACAGLAAGPCAAKIGEHLLSALGMVGVRGDPLGLYNLPGSPAFPAAVGWIFYPGLLLALRRIREPALALLLLWWLVMVLPSVFSTTSPHFLRTIGAAPATCLIWALPLALLGRALARRAPRLQPALPVAGAALVLLTAALGARDYFVRWAERPETYYDFMGYATDAAYAAEATPPEIDLYISEEYYRHATHRYLAPRSETARWFNATLAWPFPRPEVQSRYLISPATPIGQRLAPFLEGAQGEDVLNPRGQWAYTRLEFPAAPPRRRRGRVKLSAEIGGLHLDSVDLSAPQLGQDLQLTLYWHVREPTERELMLFAHLADKSDQPVAQHDAMGYPSREWRAGDRFVGLYTIPIPSTLPAARYRLILGLYDVDRPERMATSGDGARGYDLVLPPRVKIEP